jgi:hypothetical protein
VCIGPHASAQPGAGARSKRPLAANATCGCESLKASGADATGFMSTGVRGPIPAQRRPTRSAFLLFGMATPVLSVEEGAAALLASFEIVAPDKVG